MGGHLLASPGLSYQDSSVQRGKTYLDLDLNSGDILHELVKALNH